MEKLYEIDDLVDTFWQWDLDEIAYRECITNLIGTKSKSGIGGKLKEMLENWFSDDEIN